MEDAPPSRTQDSYWLSAQRLVGQYPRPTSRSGKWLVFASREIIDDLWARTRQAVEAGKLGQMAKVSTARPNPNAQKADKHVICVYTYDADDIADVRSIRQALRELGVAAKIAYKTDAATQAGQYAVKGSTRIAMYYE